MRGIDLEKLFVIAEMAQAHEGSLNTALAIIDAAASAGADAIKFQVVIADELAVPSYRYYGLYRKIEFTESQWRKLVTRAKKNGLVVLADVFGETSAEMMEGLGADGYKIHSADVLNHVLISKVAKFGKPVFLSTGGSTKEEVDQAVEILKKGNCVACLVHGYQTYPTKLEDIELNRIKILRERYSLPVGFADHISGDSPFALILPLMAFVAGATVIEKHITLDRAARGEDYYSSLNPDEFKRMVELLRGAGMAVGKASWEISEAEKQYRQESRKHIVAKRNLKGGEKVSLDMLSFKRTDSDGISDPRMVVGKILKRDIEANEVIRMEDVE